MLEQPGFWDDVEHSQQVMKELKNLKDTIEEFETLSNQYEDIGTLIEMAEEENDASLVEEIGNELASFEEKFEEFRIDTLLSEEYDANNAIVTIHAGVGGTEACDWAQMLYRMYTRLSLIHILFMKMQVSVSEATDCLRKMIGGESMGNWFENMEPMNIQEERAKTKKAEEELEESVKAMFKLLKKLCPTKEQAVQELIESYDKTEEEAQKLVEQYW